MEQEIFLCMNNSAIVNPFMKNKYVVQMTNWTLPAGVLKMHEVQHDRNLYFQAKTDIWNTLQLCACIETNRIMSKKEAVSNPVKLWPGHSHAPVVIRVVAGAAEGFLSQKYQVLLRQTSITLHLCLVLHVDDLTQLRPKHLIWHEERHPALQHTKKTAKNFHSHHTDTKYKWHTRYAFA